MPVLRQLLGVALARDWALSLIGILLVGGSAAAYSVLVGRLLGPVTLGHAGLSLAIALGTAQILTAGIGPATTRFAALRRARADEAGSRQALRNGIAGTAVAAAICSVALLVLLPPVASAFGFPIELVAPTALLVLLQSLYIVLKASLYGVGRLNSYVVAEAGAAVAFFLALARLALGSPAAIVAPFVMANGVFVVLAAADLYRHRMPTASRGSRGTLDASGEPGSATLNESMARYAAVATVGSVAALVRLQLPVLVLGLAWSAGEVGLLQASLIFLPLVLLLPRALELALFPTVSGTFASHEQGLFRKQVAVSQEVVTAALALVAGGLLICGPYLMEVLYGDAFAASGAVLDRVVIAAWALGLSVPTVSALSGADRVAVPNLAGVLGLLVSLAAWWALVPGEGAVGAAAGLAAGSLVILVLPLAAAWRRYDLQLTTSGLVFARTALLIAVSLYLSRVVGMHWLVVAAAYAAVVAAIEIPRLAKAVPGLARSTA